MQSVINDLEFSGVLNRAAKPGQAQTFSLLLSMLHQNLLERPQPAKPTWPEEQGLSSLRLPQAPTVPLKVEAAHWQQMQIQGAYIQHQLTASALLWQCLHPSPLSLHNDAKHIDEVVTENCDWYCRQRLSGHITEAMQTDETALFELLEQLHPAA
ncbi:VC2046/SO_2500 family protein [Bowmanella pacifica]|uniref:Uncharacterized protein n=1 Tax=Bowmanella pacifica TaxID=502051 RepID=A0A917Z029_9ALTE|nr:VC2046/SO_2500 family protein [Bowmanella pacifica]GGO70333.1 hypothetical protein GCM10010982_23580 [Bowmanella pacifica]